MDIYEKIQQIALNEKLEKDTVIRLLCEAVKATAMNDECTVEDIVEEFENRAREQVNG